MHKLSRSVYIIFFFLLSMSLIFQASPTLANSGTGQREMGELTDGKVKEKPQIEKLADNQYRIGSILVDKTKRIISIPGKTLSDNNNKPIEFIATMRNGYKSYESLFMLDVNAFEFNLACILIGLDSKNAVPAEFHFSPKPVLGDAVSIHISWKSNNKTVKYDIVELLKTRETKRKTKMAEAKTDTALAMPSEWSYTGSKFVGDNQYLAQMEGVLIGLVHDPASIIEHKTGIGLGRYGLISINNNIAPPQGHKILIIIQAKN